MGEREPATRAVDANDLVLPMGSVAATVVASVTGAQRMNRTALTNIAPDIFRKRLLVEGYFRSNMAESVLRDYYRHITRPLSAGNQATSHVYQLDVIAQGQTQWRREGVEVPAGATVIVVVQ